MTADPPGQDLAGTPSRGLELDTLGERARASLEAANRSREAALSLSRELVRSSANSIRCTHRGDRTGAQELLKRAEELAADLIRLQSERADIFHTGYVQDSLKEFAEARCVFALVGNQSLPDAAELGIPWPAFLNGLGETVGEMRRYSLDLLRQGSLERAEEILDIMDSVYSTLVTMDYPDAVTSGLRRTTDSVRGILERTRADITTAVLQQRLDSRMEALHRRLAE